MSPKTTRLKPSSSPVPTITPHLMPFHVDHTGSAPLSTYFIVKPAPQPDTVASDGLASITQRVKERFTSAFRGRKIQGVSVDLPDGYSGIVLKTEEPQSENGADRRKRLASAKNERRKSKRTTRSSTRCIVDDVDGDGDVPVKEETLEEEGEVVQTLCPTAKFTNLTLWNPDVDVDEGQDEYLRALSEYQQLLAEIHRIDP